MRVIPAKAHSFRLLFLEPCRESELAIAHIYLEGSEARGDVQRFVTPPVTTWEEFQMELQGLRIELAELEREAELRFADSAARRYGMGLWPKPAR